MNLYQNELYLQDVNSVANMDFPWEKLKDKSLMLSGATGLLGSFLIDVVLKKNAISGLNCKVYALGRNEEKAKKRFEGLRSENNFCFIPYDVKEVLVRDDIGRIDYLLHMASNTHPLQYATDPIGTITTNIIGLQNLLDFAIIHDVKRFAFASSNEIYGENRGDVEFFDEAYCGYINSNTLRAGYPESKRCGEALCQAYRRQKNIDIVIPRFTRSYGPTMQLADTKAISQFIKNAIAGENIILKSAGKQFYSYTYVADAISGLLTVLLLGTDGEAYNIADELSDITLRGLAEIIAEEAGTKVIFELPDEVEAAGFSKATKARLNGKKLQQLGWKPMYSIKAGITRTLQILKTI